MNDINMFSELTFTLPFNRLVWGLLGLALALISAFLIGKFPKKLTRRGIGFSLLLLSVFMFLSIFEGISMVFTAWSTFLLAIVTLFLVMESERTRSEGRREAIVRRIREWAIASLTLLHGVGQYTAEERHRQVSSGVVSVIVDSVKVGGEIKGKVSETMTTLAELGKLIVETPGISFDDGRYSAIALKLYSDLSELIVLTTTA